MTPLRRRMLDYMILKGYSESTKSTYIERLKLFALHYNRCPSEISQAEVADYLKYVSEVQNLSQSTISTTYSAIKILHVHVLGRPWDGVKLPRPKREKKRPVILSREEVQSIFSVTDNIKHKTLLMLIYSAGLRVGEVHRMRVRDLLFSRKQVFVRQGKGKKDRYSILSESVIEQLRYYLKVYRPHNWLFNGRIMTGPLSIRTIGAVYKQAKQKAGLRQPGGVHQLRHCFATHLLESGLSIYSLQRLLGHTSLRTTAGYLHLSQRDFSDFTHPLDLPV